MPAAEQEHGWNSAEEALFKRYLRRRYARVFFTPTTISLLLVGVLLNAAQNYLGGQLFSSMEMLLGFDFLIILLLAALARFFQQARRCSFFQDMLLSGRNLDRVFNPLRVGIFIFLLARAFLEVALQNLFATSWGIPYLHSTMMLLAFAIASRPLTELLLLMNACAYSFINQVLIIVYLSVFFHLGQTLVRDLVLPYVEDLSFNSSGAFLTAWMKFPNESFSGSLAALAWSRGVSVLGLAALLSLLIPLLRRGVARSTEKMIS